MPTNPSQCSRNTKQHSNEYALHIPNRHTPTNKPPRLTGRQTNQHTTMHTKNKKYIGTLLSSQTSSPHNNHTLSHAAHCEQKEFLYCQGLFSYRHFTQKRYRPCGALSVALTRIKLHSHLNKHKSPGQPFFERFNLCPSKRSFRHGEHLLGECTRAASKARLYRKPPPRRAGQPRRPAPECAEVPSQQ